MYFIYFIIPRLYNFERKTEAKLITVKILSTYILIKVLFTRVFLILINIKFLL